MIGDEVTAVTALSLFMRKKKSDEEREDVSRSAGNPPAVREFSRRKTAWSYVVAYVSERSCRKVVVSY